MTPTKPNDQPNARKGAPVLTPAQKAALAHQAEELRRSLPILT